MALTIGTNVASLQASAAASSVNRDLETSMSRLSTGKRINSAADDAAGVAIASRLSSEIRGTDQAIRNALDGQALIDTAEGGHKEIEEILQRMREVSVQGANDTNSSQDRGNLQAEMDALTTEIDRIAGVTTWAGNSVMDGGGGASTTASPASKTFSLQVGAATGAKNQIAVAIKAMDASTLGVTNIDGLLNAAADGSATGLTAAAGVAETDNVTASGATKSSGTLAITHSATAALSIDIAGETITFAKSAATTTAAARQAEAVGLAAAINANTTLQGLGIRANATADTGSASGVAVHRGADNMQSSEAAKASITAIDEAIKTVNTQRSELGAVSNRLSHTVSNMTNISTNLSAARGGIEDADFALETTNLAKNQILQQASTAMLAQANASKQNVLSLLQ
jgi:flagellin